MAGRGGKTIILGSGLAGLSAAYHSGFPVFSACDVPGGTARSVSSSGYVFDIGIHVLQSKDPYFKELLRDLGVHLVTHKRNGWIYSHGGYSLYPFQVNTSHLPLLLRLRCAIGFIGKKGTGTTDNYRDWMLQNFGGGFAETFLVPYAEKFWRVSPDEMTCDWIGGRVPSPSIKHVIKGMSRNQKTDLGTHTEFQYPSERGKGFGAIPQALASRVDGVHYGMRATSIDPGKRLVYFNGGDTCEAYDFLIPTIPLPELAELLPDLPHNVRAAVARLSFNSIAIVNLGIDRPHITDKHWVHFPEKDISFFRVSFPSNFCDGLNPEGTSSIQAEISYDREDAPGEEELVDSVLRDLVRVGILQPTDEPSFKDVMYQKYGYVIYDHARADAVKTIHSFLNDISIFPCGRYGAWEYLWSDEAVLSGKNTVEEVSRRIPAGLNASDRLEVRESHDLPSAAKEDPPALSILITNWNGWRDLKKCLESIRRSDFTDYEILVIDNASTDDSVENLRRHFPEVRLHVNQYNIGAARAFNRGCEIVRGDYILLLDPDTEVASDAVGNLVRFMKERPDVALAAPRTYNTDGTVQESARNFPSIASGLFGRQSVLTRVFPNNPFSRRYLRRDKLHAAEPFRVEQVAASCMIFPRALIADVGPWDEGFPAGRDDWVDTDWCMTLKKAQKKVFCIPSASVIHHDNNLRGKKKGMRRIWNFHWGAFRLYRRHYTYGASDPRVVLALVPLTFRAGLLIVEDLFLPKSSESNPNV